MKLPFDKIYCLHLSEDKERENQIKKQFKFLGITKQVDIWWTCKRDISNKIGKMITSLHTKFYNTYSKNNNKLYGNVFNCSFEHYSIIKQAYMRGFNNILIIEDDVVFNRDKEKIQYIMNNIPDDYDIIKFFNEFTNNLYDNEPVKFINNKTDLKINLWDLKNPEKETLFENCVADVNIPVGEVFTSPVLSGTDGVLHVSEVFLNGLKFENLKVTFKDGMMTMTVDDDDGPIFNYQLSILNY